MMIFLIVLKNLSHYFSHLTLLLTNTLLTKNELNAKAAFFSIFFSIKCGKQLWSHFSDERPRKADTGKHLTT